MYVGICVYMCICECIGSLCACVCVHMCVYVGICGDMCIYVHLYRRMCAYVYVCASVSVLGACVHAYVCGALSVPVQTTINPCVLKPAALSPEIFCYSTQHRRAPGAPGSPGGVGPGPWECAVLASTQTQLPLNEGPPLGEASDHRSWP